MLQCSIKCNITNYAANKEQIMPSTFKSSKSSKPAAPAANAEFVDTITPAVMSSVERIAELQKKSLDLAAEQAADWIGAWKKAFAGFPAAPPAVIFDTTTAAFQATVETQKDAIDLMVEQTKSAVAIAKVRADAYSQIVEGVAGAIRTSVERSAEAQRKALEFASEQNEAIFASAKKQLGTAGGPATVIVDSFHRGADAAIEAQKSILNITSEAVAAAARA
jgi:hypothetical protein